MDASVPDLPEEVIEVILSKSDVKSVLRSTSVSKSWQSIISDPRFPGVHHIRRSQLLENHNKSLVWAMPKKKPGYRIYLEKFQDGKFVTESVFPYQLREFVMPLCYCNGIILLGADVDKFCYLLWNPSIRKSTVILGLHRDANPHPSLHHFYYDSVTEDYKIVLVYKDCVYAVYSCKDRVWSETRVLPCDVRLIHDGDAVDGCFYALSDVNDEIVCFDARDGTAEKLRQPEGVKGLIEVTVRAVSGRLCLYGWSFDRRKLQMWVMEKASGSFCSWRKVVAMEKAEGNLCMLRPRFLSNEDEVIMSAIIFCEKMEDKYFIYNPRQKRFREMKVDWECGKFYPYSENLYMPCSNMEMEL